MVVLVLAIKIVLKPDLLSRAKASEALLERIPKEITAFEEAFQNLELRQQKAQLQTILKAARIYKDGKIELEFRG